MNPRPLLPEIEIRRGDVAALCRSFGVDRLDLFGSAARGEARPSSDLDFVVSFAPPHDQGYAERYLGLAEALESLFGRPVDLVTDRSVRNPVLRHAIAKDRQTLYAG
jgi:predicted nucleotidyltransferase